jgi:hypothetical protein
MEPSTRVVKWTSGIREGVAILDLDVTPTEWALEQFDFFDGHEVRVDEPLDLAEWDASDVFHLAQYDVMSGEPIIDEAISVEYETVIVTNEALMQLLNDQLFAKVEAN